MTFSTTKDRRFDFSNPFFAATITTPEGKRFPLWTRIGAEESASLGKEGLQGTRALSFVQEITIEMQLAHLPIIKVQLTPPYRDAINFLDSRLMEWTQSTLEVQFGYISNSSGAAVLSAVFSGVLLKPEVQLGQDVVITLNAQGVSGFSAKRQGGSRTFANISRREMIRIVAEGRTAEAVAPSVENFSPENDATEITKEAKKVQKKGRSPGKNSALLRFDPNRFGIGDLKLIEDSLVAARGAAAKARNKRLTAKLDDKLNDTRIARALLVATSSTTIGLPKPRDIEVNFDAVTEANDPEAFKLLTKEVGSRTQGGDTDWLFIWKLAREAQCFVLWDVDRNKTGKAANILHVFPHNHSLTKKPKRRFRLYDYPAGTIGPAAGVFPILSASSPNMYIYMPGSSRGYSMTGTNSETRETETMLVGDDAKVGRTGKGGCTPGDSGKFPSTNPSTGDGAAKFPGSPVDGQAVAQAKSEYAAKTFGMGVNLTLETLADPDLFPGDTIEVRGLGRLIDEYNYAVFKQTFTLGTSGSSMSVECFSNAAALHNQVSCRGPVGSKGDDEPKDKSKTTVNAKEE